MKSILIILTSIILSSSANAHGAADWINRGQYRNKVGEFCCGENDCKITTADYISRPVAGYTLPDGSFVNEHEAQPSPDGQFWVCVWGGRIKCFFAPMPTG